MKNENPAPVLCVDECIDEEVLSLVKLQLIGAATGQNGLISVRALYSNIEKFSNITISYGEFIDLLELNRSQFKIPSDKKLGADINYISLKR